MSILALFTITRGDCGRAMRRGWWCSRWPGHEGPCALRPRWWNHAESARRYRVSKWGMR